MSTLLIIKLAMLSSIIFLILILYPPPCYGDTNFPLGTLCDLPRPGDNSTSVLANRNSVFTSLVANAIKNRGYYEAESGKKPDRIYGQILCRGDISPSDCEACTQEAIRTACTSRSGIVWQNWCMLRFSTTRFYGSWDLTRSAILLVNATSDADRDVVAEGLRMMEGFSVNDSPLLFSMMSADGRRGRTVYGIVQCTRDLESNECNDCLRYIFENSRAGIETGRQWVINGVGCQMWYSDTWFFVNGTSNVLSSRAHPTASRAWAAQILMTMILSMMVLIS